MNFKNLKKVDKSLITITIFESLIPAILVTFIAFFTLSGIDLNLAALKYAGLMGIGYVVVRSLVKILGAYMGAKITNSNNVVQKHLGLTLLPQAGVAIGLSMIAQTVMPTMGSTIRTIILASTVIYELLGPFIAKTALIKAGEIDIKALT